MEGRVPFSPSAMEARSGTLALLNVCVGPALSGIRLIVCGVKMGKSGMNPL